MKQEVPGNNIEEIVYLNKEYLPLREARVSVMDRGFLLSDGIYEVIPIYNSRPFALRDHYQRLLQSLQDVHINSIFSYQDFSDIITTLIERNVSFPVQNCYFQITRGVSATRKQFETNLTPTIFAKLEVSGSNKNLTTGLKTITVDDIRWARCDIKGINRLANVLMAQQVYSANADDGIIVKDDNAIEGVSSNLFIVEKGVVITPPISENILSGVTRKIVIALVKSHGCKCIEESISLDRLFSADEVWLTSSVIGVAVVNQINDIKVGNAVNSVGVVIQKAYLEDTDNMMNIAQ